MKRADQLEICNQRNDMVVIALSLPLTLYIPKLELKKSTPNLHMNVYNIPSGQKLGTMRTPLDGEKLNYDTSIPWNITQQ